MAQPAECSIIRVSILEGGYIMDKSSVDACIKSLRLVLDEHLLPSSHEWWAQQVLSCLEDDINLLRFDDYHIIRLSLWVCIGAFGDAEYKKAYLDISKIIIDKIR